MSVNDPRATSALGLSTTRSGNERAAEFLVASMAIGEVSVGMVLLVLPRELSLVLLDAVLDGRSSIVARMMGVAVLALGVTWWKAGGDPERLSRYSAGFILYNVGVGVLFGWAAIAASQPALPWIVCVAHVAAGVAFVALIWRSPSRKKAETV